MRLCIEIVVSYIISYDIANSDIMIRYNGLGIGLANLLHSGPPSDPLLQLHAC
jgi:hypothetical protein